MRRKKGYLDKNVFEINSLKTKGMFFALTKKKKNYYFDIKLFQLITTKIKSKYFLKNIYLQGQIRLRK